MASAKAISKGDRVRGYDPDYELHFEGIVTKIEQLDLHERTVVAFVSNETTGPFEGKTVALPVEAWTRRVICDFCGSPDPKWSFPARDFHLGADRVSADGWAACPACHALVLRGDRDKLAMRSAKRIARAHRLPLHGIPAQVRAMQDDFWANRLGDPVPLDV